jgi:hypothetical protein
MKRALSAALLLAPRAAGACAVCFGGADTQKGFFDGLGWAIVILLAVTLSLVGGIAYALWTVEKARAGKGA